MTTALTTTAQVPTELATAAVALVEASRSPNTLRTYGSALANYDAWRDQHGWPIEDETLALYLGALAQKGRSAALASTVVCAARARGDHVGKLAESALAGFRRKDASRLKRQAEPWSAEQVLAMVAVAHRPRKRGRGMASAGSVAKRATEDKAIIGCLFYAAMRRSEVAALKAGDVRPQDDGTVLVRVRRGKANQAGDVEDVRLVKHEPAAALAEAVRGQPATVRVFNISPHTINDRIQALAKAAGIKGRVSAHSGRRGVATELVKHGADTASVMLAGGWKSASMVTQYAASVDARQGAVAKHL